MSRFARAVDANQAEVVAALRRAGAFVVITSSLGNGFPDLLVWHRGRTFLLEVKDGAKPPSARQLTEAEARWHRTWPGELYTVNSAAEAVAVLASEQVKARTT